MKARMAGLERMLPLAQAIHAAEQAAIEHGPGIARGKQGPAPHRAAWAALKAALERLNTVWDDRQARARKLPAFTFGDLDALNQRLTAWMSGLCEEAMHWRDWGSYAQCETRSRTHGLIASAQELEKRMAVAESEPRVMARAGGNHKRDSKRGLTKTVKREMVRQFLTDNYPTGYTGKNLKDLTGEIKQDTGLQLSVTWLSRSKLVKGRLGNPAIPHSKKGEREATSTRMADANDEGIETY